MTAVPATSDFDAATCLAHLSSVSLPAAALAPSANTGAVAPSTSLASRPLSRDGAETANCRPSATLPEVAAT